MFWSRLVLFSGIVTIPVSKQEAIRCISYFDVYKKKILKKIPVRKMHSVVMYLPYLTKGGKWKVETFYLLDVLLMTKIKCWPVDKIYLEFSQSMSIDCDVEPNVYEIVLIYWYNYLWNQCLSPLCWEFESRPWRGVLDKLCDKVYQWLSTDRFFPPGTAVSSTDKLTATIELKYCWKWR